MAHLGARGTRDDASVRHCRTRALRGGYILLTLTPQGIDVVQCDDSRPHGVDMSERIKQPSLLGELSAEFAGTMILILFGCGVVAQVVTSKGGLGGHDSIAWAWGLGVVLGVYA